MYRPEILLLIITPQLRVCNPEGLPRGAELKTKISSPNIFNAFPSRTALTIAPPTKTPLLTQPISEPKIQTRIKIIPMSVNKEIEKVGIRGRQFCPMLDIAKRALCLSNQVLSKAGDFHKG